MKERLTEVVIMLLWGAFLAMGLSAMVLATVACVTLTLGLLGVL